MRRITVVTIIAAALLANPAAARRHHAQVPNLGLLGPIGGLTTERPPQGRQATLLPHPAGCPRRLFCGCGVAVDVFGHPVRSLYLAANWLRFPRTAPAPGAVAARHGHVMRLREHVGGDVWLVYDPNGGRGGTWLHHRSIRGYTIVSPG